MRELRYYRGVPVPFITTWGNEVDTIPPGTGGGTRVNLVGLPGSSILRVSYADESPHDRDAHGVLWQRYPLAPGKGVPHFAKIHPARQRLCMTKRLCQVCGNPADQDADGWLWLLTRKDAEAVRAGTQNAARTSNPPVCLRCADLARELCPHLLKGNALVRAGVVTDWGVYGIEVYPDGSVAGGDRAYSDPAVIQMLAGQQLVTIAHLTVIS